MEKLREEDSPWNRLVGICFSVPTAAKTLGVTPEELAEKAGRLELLELVTADEVTVYPAFQFRGGAVIPGLPEILKELKRGIDDPWTWVIWLRSEFSVNGETEESAISRLLSGELEEVVAIARDDANGWRR